MSSPRVPFVQTARGRVEAACVEISFLVCRLRLFSGLTFLCKYNEKGP